MFTRWTVSLPKDIQALLSGRKNIDDTTKLRTHAFLAEIGSPDRALMTCAVIAGLLADKNLTQIPALAVIKTLASRILNQSTILDENDAETLEPLEISEHFIRVRDDLRTLAEAMQMTSDAFGPDMARAGWLAYALSQQAHAHSLIAETVADAHLDSGNKPRRKSKKAENFVCV
jgi:hypothetical protein